MTPEAHRIAARLTETQRHQILLCEAKGRNTLTDEACSFRAYARREATADVLVRLGLSYYDRSGMGHRVIDLTPLGLAVRAILTGEKADG